MPLNIPGILVHFQLLVNPRLVIPGVTKDIRQLDFLALRQAGYRGAVFDKDNCLTVPHRDTIVPELEEAWRQCRETFGDGNVVIVSNMAGTSHDAGQLEAESVTHYLGVPVLRHRSLRHPLQDHELIIVGDRILTDVVMANRMLVHRKPQSSDEKADRLLSRRGPLAIWTTGLWERENMMIRWWETRLVNLANRWIPRDDISQTNTSHFVCKEEET